MPSKKDVLETKPEFTSVPGGGKLIGVSKETMWRAIRQKKLRRFKVGARTLVRVADVLALVKEA